MGTKYKLYEDGFFGELSISEMSNKLELTHEPPIDSGAWINSSVEMTPEAMAKIMLEGLTVCSYWMDTDELKALIADHVDKKIY